MRVVVTGGGGFIGSHLTDALLKRGDEVLVLDDFSTGRKANLEGALKAFSKQLTVTEADVASPAAARAVISFRPELIVNLAAQMNVRRSVREPVFDAHTNVLGIVNMLESAREAGTKRFVFSSTGGAIYGEQVRFPADESDPCHSECPYGVSKLCGEFYMEYFARANNLSCTALRFGNVYGPRQNPKGEAGVVAIFCERLLRGEELIVNGEGTQTRDFIFVGDVVAAILTAAGLEKPGVFSVYNVGWGKEISILDLVTGLRRAWEDVRRGGEHEFVAVKNGPGLPGEQLRSVISPKKIRAELGWEPRVSFGEGLVLTLESFRMQ